MNLTRSAPWIIIILAAISCSPVQTEINLNELTIDTIHEAFRNGDYTAEELTLAYINRIQKIDTVINAITVINPDAIDRARELDETFKATGQLKPLHGIPVIVKDNINTRSLLTTGGARALSEYLPGEDAFIIKKLTEAGAIILAKSNMAEWAFSPMHTESTTFGTTRNPYDTSRVPAGSSGGTAAAVAANLGTIGLGTDTGNSIRGPSSHCALVGFRTTMGLVSREGIIPLYLRNDIVGPMCRTVTDAVRTLQAIAGPDEADPVTSHGASFSGYEYEKHLLGKGLENKRIGVLRTLTSTIHPEIDVLFDKALQDLTAAGATIVDPLEVPDFDSLRTDQWCAVFRQDVEAFLGKYVHNDTVATLEDIIRIGTTSDYARQSLEYFRENEGRSGNKNIPCLDAFNDERRIAFREAITRAMDNLNLDAIVYPSWNFPPAQISAFREEYKGDNSQVISPHTGQPAFTVPMGYTSKGLPAGIQFLGRMFSEPTLIEISYAYEQATLHRLPPGIESNPN